MVLNIAFFISIILPLPVITKGLVRRQEPMSVVVRGTLIGVIGAFIVILLSMSTDASAAGQLTDMLSELNRQIAGTEAGLLQMGLTQEEADSRIALLTSTYSTAFQLMPAMIFAVACVASYLEYLLLSKILRKGGADVLRMPPTREFNLSRGGGLGWVLLYLISFIFMVDGEAFGLAVTLNIEVLTRMVFAYQGISLVFCFAYKKNIPKAVAVIFIIFMLFLKVGMFLFMFAGLFDMMLGLKARIKDKRRT